MKIYEHSPKELIRLQITKQGEDTKYLTLYETDAEETEAVLKNLIEAQSISPFSGGRKTSIVIRKAVGGKNGKAKSISFYGLSTQQVYDLVVNHLDK